MSAIGKTFTFIVRRRRARRYGKYSGHPATVLHEYPGGKLLVECKEERFSVYPDELIKRIHGSPQNIIYNDDGTVKL